MSGGYFEYKQYAIDELVDRIERILPREDQSRSSDTDGYYDDSWTKKMVAECSPETIQELQNAVRALKQAAVYAQRVDWFLSGDDGEISFHQRLKEELNNID